MEIARGAAIAEREIKRHVSAYRSRRYCPFGSRERLRQIIAGGSLSQAVLMTRAEPLRHEHLHRRNKQDPGPMSRPRRCLFQLRLRRCNPDSFFIRAARFVEAVG